jgi:hypothetical protein
MPGGGEAQWKMTLGFSPEKNRYVGTWVGSMMTHQWVYEGELDASGKVLPLYCDGPPSKDGKSARFKDVLTWIDDDHRTLTAWMTDEQAQWRMIMAGRFVRVK